MTYSDNRPPRSVGFSKQSGLTSDIVDVSIEASNVSLNFVLFLRKPLHNDCVTTDGFASIDERKKLLRNCCGTEIDQQEATRISGKAYGE